MEAATLVFIMLGLIVGFTMGLYIGYVMARSK